jgi:hypothetical protein
MNGLLLLLKIISGRKYSALFVALLIGLSLIPGAFAPLARAAGAIGTAVQTVIAAISLRKVSDLDFGNAAPNDPAKTVPAGTGETSENASFAVYGEPGRNFTILLPSDGSVQMTTRSGLLPNESIPVLGFTSFPARVGTLGPTGEAMLYVGATRSALKPNQALGRYSGTFTVNVVY